MTPKDKLTQVNLYGTFDNYRVAYTQSDFFRHCVKFFFFYFDVRKRNRQFSTKWSSDQFSDQLKSFKLKKIYL